jgi:hypothetical protein
VTDRVRWFVRRLGAAALGIAVDREDLRNTPAWMARAYAELFSTLPLRADPRSRAEFFALGGVPR